MLMLVAVAPARSNSVSEANASKSPSQAKGWIAPQAQDGVVATETIIRYGTRESSETLRMETSPFDHAKRVYIHGGYNLHFSTNTGDLNSTGVFNSMQFQDNWFAGIGARWTNSVRTELTFEQFTNEWEELGTSHGYFGFVNVLFDARVDGAFQRHVTSPFTPFVGFGAGAGVFEFGNATVNQSRRTAGAYNLIAGLTIDLNRTVALVISYRYTRILSPNNLEWDNFHGYDQMLWPDGYPMYGTDGLPVWDYNSPIVTNHDFQGFRPTSHNLGLSLRMSF